MFANILFYLLTEYTMSMMPYDAKPMDLSFIDESNKKPSFSTSTLKNNIEGKTKKQTPSTTYSS